MSAKLTSDAFKLSTSKACALLGAVSALAVATALTIAGLLGLIVDRTAFVRVEGTDVMVMKPA